MHQESSNLTATPKVPAPLQPGHVAFVGRQPIFDRKLELFAYELLFRSGHHDAAIFDDPDRATAEVFCSTFMDIGLDTVVGNAKAFINLPRAFLLGPYPELFPKDRVVLEILEDVPPDPEVIERVTYLRDKGYTIALDDFCYRPQLEPLARLAHLIKIDVRALTRAQLEEHTKILHDYPCELLAEKVETSDEVAWCRDRGFVLFQGHFLCRPEVLEERVVPPDRVASLELIRKVHDPRTSLTEVEEVISCDVALSFNLLRYINSGLFSLPVRIESIHHALVMLGVEGLRSWVGLLVLVRFSGKPHELMVTAMLRGKMCGELGGELGADAQESAFTVGLFSTLDALMDRPMEDILDMLQLSDELREALLERKGRLGQILSTVLAYEQGDWDEVVTLGADLDQEAIRDAYLESLRWVAKARGMLG